MDAPVSEASAVRIRNVDILNGITEHLMWEHPGFWKSGAIKSVCRSVQEDIEKLDGVVRVYPSYKILDVRRRELVFVICTDINSEMIKKDLPLVYEDLNVIFRNVNNQGGENDYVVSSAEYRDSDVPQYDSSDLNKSLFGQYDTLLKKHSNLMSLVTSQIKSTGYGTPNARLVKRPCIVLFVIAKGYIPLYEEECPKLIERFMTDVREGQLQLYGLHRAQAYHKTLRMGCAISGVKQHQGTLGVFVHKNEKTYFITSAHVLLSGEPYKYLLSNGNIEGLINTPDVQPDDQVYQPSSATTSHVNTGAPIGRITKAVYRLGDYSKAGVEAVLVELTDNNRFPNAGNFPDGDFTGMGFTAEAPMSFNSGETVDQTQSSLIRTEVLKFGSETGITRGLFKLAGNSVHRVIFKDNVQVVLNSQLQVLGTSECQFAAPGDSGALVFIPHQGNDKDLRALGIVTGGIGQCVCCVTPIWDVLEVLGPNLKLKTFR